jgi:hypothetical protein
VLAKTGRLELLGTLYDEVWIPSAVLEEVQDPDRSDTKAIRRWCRNESSVSIPAVAEAVRKSIPEELGSGERAAIALAVARDADLVILDDQEGRRAARAEGLAVTGTIGVLVEARAEGHIDSLRVELDRVVDAGLWISEAFYERLLREFGES